MKELPRQLSRTAGALLVLLGSMLGFAATATPAAAESPQPDLPVSAPEPGEGLIIAVPVFELLVPTATVEVSCATETATAKLGNKTSNYYPITIEVDDVVVEAGPVGPDEQMTATFQLSENETKHVEIAAGSTKYYDSHVKRDCLHPDTAYQVLSSCASGQAHARLINNGDDTAYMAVDYPGDANALQAVGAHSSTDWLLEVAPGEAVDFTVRDSDGELGSDSFDFVCGQPEPAPQPQPQPQPAPAPQPQPEPEPQPEAEPQPQSEDHEAPIAPAAADTDGPAGPASEGAAGGSGSKSEPSTIIEATEPSTEVLGAAEPAAEPVVESQPGPSAGPRSTAGGSNVDLAIAFLWGLVTALVVGVTGWALRRRNAVSFP